MADRRSFIKTGINVGSLLLLPAVNSFGNERSAYRRKAAGNLKLRFAIASDGHYGQAGTDYKKFFSDLVVWINEDHKKNHLDFVIFNGDLVHDRPDLLGEVKSDYFDKLNVPFYTTQGNHDKATPELWHSVFGHADDLSVEHGDQALVIANTSNLKGEFLCPSNVFLKQELDKFRAKKTVFVVLHIPPVQWMKEEASIFANCPETMRLIQSYPNVKALFHGHDHNLDSARYSGKTAHFFDSHIGGNWGTSYKGYRIVEVNEQDEVSTYQVNASQNPVLNSVSIK